MRSFQLDIAVAANLPYALKRRARNLSGRDQYLLDPFFAADVGERPVRVIDVQPVDDLSFFQRIVIYKSDRTLVQTRIVTELTQNHLTATTPTIDQNTPGIRHRCVRKKLAYQTKRHTANDEHYEKQDRIDHKDRT